MHSATKFIAGHSALMAGVIAVKGDRLVMFWLYICLLSHTNLSRFFSLLSGYHGFSSIYMLTRLAHRMIGGRSSP